MDIALDPLLAILGIFIPLGLVYVILLFQSHAPDYAHRKVLDKRAELQREGTELTCSEKKLVAQLMRYWLL